MIIWLNFKQKNGRRAKIAKVSNSEKNLNIPSEYFHNFMFQNFDVS